MTKTTAKDSLRGIFPALMTAFSDDGIRTDAVTALVQKLAADGVDGFYVGGSSGEMVLCSSEERQRLLETVREAAGSLPVIAHIGAMSTRDAAANFPRFRQPPEQAGTVIYGKAGCADAMLIDVRRCFDTVYAIRRAEVCAGNRPFSRSGWGIWSCTR